VKLGSVPNLIVVPEGEDQLKYRVEKSAQVGLSCMGVFLRPEMMDAAYLESVAELAEKRGIELRGGGGGNFYLEGDEARAEVERVAERLTFLAGHLGITYSSLASGPMLTHHRFADGPPLEQRKATLSTNLAALADAVEPAGLTLALENHCDWRGHEIAQIVKGANRPNLMMQIDTGNAVSVFEEPVDCARAMAPWVVSSHLKDIHVTPFATGECRGSRAVAVPLGEGHVDNVAICEILAKEAPDPKSIALIIEPFYVPDGADVNAFFETSVAWAKKHLARFLS